MALPWVYLKGAKVIDGVVKLPISGVNFTQAPNDYLKVFMGEMLGGDVPLAQVPAQLYAQAARDPQSYARRYAGSIASIVDGTIDAYRKLYGLDTSRWPLEAKRTVLTSELAGDGHGLMVATLEPHPDPKGVITSHNQLRYLGSAFPGQFASVSPAQFAQIVGGGREIDGTPVERILHLWPDIIERNAGQFKQQAPLDGLHALGWNSFIDARCHFIERSGGSIVQSALFRTTFRHSQDGAVPWTSLYHPDFPGGLVYVSLHFGKNPVPLGDAVNAAIAGGLFKTIFRSGNLLSAYHGQLAAKYGPDQAAALLLDLQNERDFRQHVAVEDWHINADTSVFSTLDATGGTLVNALRMFNPNEIALVDASAYEQAASGGELEQLAESGAALAKERDYAGPGGVEAPDAAIVPNAGTSTVGYAALTAELDPYNPSNQLDESLKSFADTSRKLAAELPWDYIERQARAEVDEAAGQAIGEADVLSKTPAEWAAALDTPELRSRVRERTDRLIWEGLAQDAAYAGVIGQLGEAGAQSVAGLAVGGPVFGRLTAGTEGSSWLDAALLGSVLGRQAHASAAQADKLQEQAAGAADQAAMTAQEAAARQADLAAVNAELQRTPDKPELLERQRELEREIAELAEAQKQAEAERNEYKERESVQREQSEERRQRQQEEERVLIDKGRDVFHGE